MIQVGTVVEQPGALDGPLGEQLDWCVIRATFDGLPRARTVTGWVNRAGVIAPSARLGLYAWCGLTHGSRDLRPGLLGAGPEPLARGQGRLAWDEPAARAWERLRALLGRLAEPALVLRTPVGFAPTATSRRRLHDFAELARLAAIAVVWEPEGLWDPDDVLRTCAQLGWRAVLPAFTATGALEERAGPAWLRVDPICADGRLRPERAEQLAGLEAAAGGSAPVVWCAGPFAQVDAALLLRALGRGPTAGGRRPGGPGPARPRRATDRAGSRRGRTTKGAVTAR